MTHNNFGSCIYFHIQELQKYQFDQFYSDENTPVNDRYPTATAGNDIRLNFPVTTA